MYILYFRLVFMLENREIAGGEGEKQNISAAWLPWEETLVPDFEFVLCLQRL